MKVLNIAIAAAALLVAAPSMADVLADQKCNTCHDASAKKVGPTWKDIAAKASADDIKAALSKGSKGKYGKIPMPPQPKAVGAGDDIVKAIMAHK